MTIVAMKTLTDSVDKYMVEELVQQSTKRMELKQKDRYLKDKKWRALEKKLKRKSREKWYILWIHIYLKQNDLILSDHIY